MPDRIDNSVPLYGVVIEERPPMLFKSTAEFGWTEPATGWVCPLCNMVNAPHIAQCPTDHARTGKDAKSLTALLDNLNDR